MIGGPTTVKEFKRLIASIPEECDDYRVVDQGWTDLEWISLIDKGNRCVVAFGWYPDKYPIELERRDQ